MIPAGPANGRIARSTALFVTHTRPSSRKRVNEAQRSVCGRAPWPNRPPPGAYLIVAEIEQLPSRRNFPLNSKAQISDGSVRRYFVLRRKSLYREFNA